eukprot:CCRYP_017350-RA/>CCRYP_017350-RA protein AED:0.48 eAED:-0.34 QI:0/0/0/0.33/1/1/3/0/445
MVHGTLLTIDKTDRGKILDNLKTKRVGGLNPALKTNKKLLASLPEDYKSLFADMIPSPDLDTKILDPMFSTKNSLDYRITKVKNSYGPMTPVDARKWPAYDRSYQESMPALTQTTADRILDQYQTRFGQPNGRPIVSSTKGKKDPPIKMTHPQYPSRRQLVKKCHMKERLETPGFRVDTLELEDVLLFIIHPDASDYLTNDDWNNLRQLDDGFRRIIDEAFRLRDVDFWSLIEPGYDYASQQTVPQRRIDQAVACLLHYKGEIGMLVPFLDGEYTGAARDVVSILQSIQPYVDHRDYADIRRILTEGAPAKIELRQCPLALDKWVGQRVLHQATFLGLQFDTRRMTISVPQEYQKKVIDCIDSTWHKNRKTFRASELEELVGKCGRLGAGASWAYHLVTQMYASVIYVLTENKKDLYETSPSFKACLDMIKTTKRRDNNPLFAAK